MSNEYKRLKEELDSTDLDSILPSFDREASWKELSPRLKKTQKRTVAWRYAAALVAIVIVAALVRMQLSKQDDEQQIATTVKPVATPATVDTNIAVEQPKTEAAHVSDHAIAVQKTKTHKTNPAPKIKNEEPQPQEELIADTQEKPEANEAQQPVEEQPIVTQAKPVIKRPKAVHLLDIDNENRQAAIQNRNELQGLSQRKVNLIPGRQYSNTDNARKPTSLFKVN